VERRFAIFLVLTLLLWTGFIALRVWLAPNPPAKPIAQQPALKDGGKKGQPAAQPGKLPAEDPAVKPPNDPQVAAVPVPAAPSAPRKKGGLGSQDPNSPYRMFATWDSLGAAIERVELNGARYKSVEDYTGYLGHLDLTDAVGGGAEVQIVGPGTPAALAKPHAANIAIGLKVGDVIHEIDGQKVADRHTVPDYLEEKTHPEQKIVLRVRRAGADKPLDFTAQLTRRPLEVVKPEQHTYKTEGGGLRVLPQDPLSLLMTLDNIGGRSVRAGDKEIAELPSLYTSNWTVEDAKENFVEFSFTFSEEQLAKIKKSGPLKIVKRYELAKSDNAKQPGFHLNLRITVQNLSKEAMPLGYRLDGPTGLPTEGWWYSTKLHPIMFKGAGSRDVVYRREKHDHEMKAGPAIVSESKAYIADQKPPVISIFTGDQPAAFDYLGVDTQFFAAALKPNPDSHIKFRTAHAMAVQDVAVIPKNWLRTTDVSFRVSTDPTIVQPGAELKHDYLVFFGPKDYRVLAQQPYGLEKFIEYGWSIFAYPAKGLQWLLNVLHSVTKNYGISIILLTVIVRSCMIPISLKQARTAAKMQELAPEVQKIKDRYPDDPMKQHTAVQELYKKHNFNMFGGCLPVFLQLPVFIGLYRCLSVNIELRDAPLIPGIAWASNLAGPDKLFFWKDWMPAFIADEADGYLGPFFNVLPLITVTLFLIQQKMITPPATDEQTRMQQQMMTYMTVFMGVMFYKVPAGLCLYFITSSLWGICERKLLPKKQKTSDTTALPDKPPAKPAVSNGAVKDSVKEKLAKRARQKR